MLVYTPQPSVYPTMSRPSEPLFKRQKTRSDAPRPSQRNVSPAGSFFGGGRRPHDLPPHGASPPGSFYSQSSSSSPSVASASSSKSRKELGSSPPPLHLGSSWLARSPRSRPPLSTLSPAAAEFTSQPDTPTEVPEAELRRRQLEKATRILGESVPLELVFQPRHPLVQSFPDPPLRRSSDSSQPGQQPREMLTERRAGRIVRRASRSFSTFASKLRSVTSTSHSRDSSQESHSASSSDLSHQSSITPARPSAFSPTLLRRRSSARISPITFAFPHATRSPSRPQISPPSPTKADFDPVIDIRSLDSSADEHDGYDDDETTPVHGRTAPHLPPLYFYSQPEVLPRVVPLPSPTYTHAGLEHFYSRPETPFDSSRPGTPFTHLARPTTPSTDLDSGEPAPSHAPVSAAHASRVSRRERGQGWSGEWNQRDMQAVIHKLRTLK
ncbi:hypothetical protein B0H17DRAFT_1177453 [Mycena rosella]|uniref:Uncharacterized protein n=1 Tax=Mycena rosella TaxID=1033263 RepID=A0AAD7DRD9_MYCRO|nr:hypothetical protein B0H17DRAFT_1177453 [Mycena rosella]